MTIVGREQRQPESLVASAALSRRTLRPGRRLGDCLLAVMLLGALLLVTERYIAHERTFYFYDTAGYHNLASDFAGLYRQSPEKAWRLFKYAHHSDYNLLFAVPLLPFLLVFDTSRQTYELALTLVYTFPFLLVLGLIGARLFPQRGRVAFWLTVAIGALTPALWVPTLRGYPDVGAALLIALATLALLHDLTMRQRWQPITIGFLLAGATMVRRHFAYAVIAFLVAATLTALLHAVREGRGSHRAIFSDARRLGVRLIFVAIACIVTIEVLDFPLFYRLIFENYTVLFASYMRPPAAMAAWTLATFGGATCALSLLGYGIAARRRIFVPEGMFFVVAQGMLALLLWLLVVRQPGGHYALHFTPLIIFGLVALVLALERIPAGAVSRVALGLGLAAQLALGLAPVPFTIPPLSLIPQSQPPMVRDDYADVASLLTYLRETVGDAPVYVAASSTLLNADILANAERVIYPAEVPSLRLLPTADIDSRDRAALSNLLNADVVVVTDPPQQHLDPAQQRVVAVVDTLFAEDGAFTRDFTPLPRQFTLGATSNARPAAGLAPAGQATITIYRRIRPTSADLATQTLADLERAIYGSKP